LRDHSKLVAFHAADALVLAVFSATRAFPAQQRFGLAVQLQRAAVSVAANTVEGCARETATEYARFLSIAYASAREAQYEIDVAIRLELVSADVAQELRLAADRTSQLLNHLCTSVRGFRAREPRRSAGA
jgi:four helix bundle protein